MDIADALSFMVAFGALIALIMSDKNHKKYPLVAKQAEGVILILHTSPLLWGYGLLWPPTLERVATFLYSMA